MESVHGSCLCQSVKVKLETKERAFDVCHCGMCRKWSGGPAMSVDGSANVQIEGQDSITVYSSSPWAERGFCKKCGTHLFYRLKKGGYYNFPLGLLDGTEGFRMRMQIFIDRKPKVYSFTEKTECMTEAEVVAKFGPPPG